MDTETAATLQLIAQAFALSPTSYSVTVAPHPVRPQTYDVLFSLPTAEAPESPLFVRLTLTERSGASHSGGDGVRYFDGVVESQRSPIPFTIDGSSVLKGFPHECIDVAWAQKLRVNGTPLWAE